MADDGTVIVPYSIDWRHGAADNAARVGTNIVSTNDFDPLPPRWQTTWRWSLISLTVAALACLAWDCLQNPKIHFLAPGPGKWIVYPLPPRLETYAAFKLTGTFRRSFMLATRPAAAVVLWRCFTNGELRVNGTVVPIPDFAFENWKNTLRTDVGPYLHQGSNEISVEVENQLGPPALSLNLDAGDFSLASDDTWEVSVSGSNWRPAQAAAAIPKPGKGNELYLMETTAGAFRQCWPWLCFFAVISTGGVALVRYGTRFPFNFTRILLFVIGAAWALLFLHNFPSMPLVAGFDAPDHLAYVRYIRDYNILPSAWEGAEMFQAPLYYVLSAVLLSAGHCQVFEPSGMLLLRLLGLVIGAVNLALIYAGLKLIFPGDWKKPLAGFALAAFLPAQIYLLHYTTNETLAAMFMTASLYAGLRLVCVSKPWWGWHGALGIFLGLALLSKSSAVLAIPPIFSVLTIKLLLRRERLIRVWLGVIAAPLAIAAGISGWHYVKLWSQYGNPLVLGSWNATGAIPWWQYKGLQTLRYFCDFGTVLSHPFFSGMHSFCDGFYSTLWGDGLLAGSNLYWIRPPWNYNFMAVGYLLALAPSVLVLTGLIRTLTALFCKASLPWIMLILFGWLNALALVAMCLKIPHYAQAKAFFGLPVLLLFCALGALGFEFWAARGKVVMGVLGVLLGTWMINIYATFWIHPHAVQTELSSALVAAGFHQPDNSTAFAHILQNNPRNSEAAIWLASLEAKTNPAQAVARLEETLRNDPANDQIEVALARILALDRQLDKAVAHAKRAVELAPENEDACNTWCALALQDKNYADTVVAGQDALSLCPANQVTHYNLGLALIEMRQFAAAGQHFSAIVDAQPASAPAQYGLGLCLIEQPARRDDGLAHIEEAVRLDPANTGWQLTLQKLRQAR